jgi:hypothetical protein
MLKESVVVCVLKESIQRGEGGPRHFHSLHSLFSEQRTKLFNSPSLCLYVRLHVLKSGAGVQSSSQQRAEHPVDRGAAVGVQPGTARVSEPRRPAAQVEAA